MSIPNLDIEVPQEEQVYYYRLAGQIAYEVHEALKELITPGARLIEICDRAHALILEKGGQPGYPTQLNINNIATHYAPPNEDETVIPEGSVVKLDLGVHVNGFIASKAETYCFNDEYKPLVEASQQAWRNAMELVRVGTETAMIGVAVEDTVREFNYLPIRELTGHLLDRYQLHGNKVLPNVRLPFSKADSVLEANEVYAFETFASTGSGSVHEDHSKTYIYMMRPQRIPLRSKESRKIRNYIFKEYFTLPFASRWVEAHPDFHPARARLTIRELRKANGLIEFPVLADIKEAYVSQYQNTFMLSEEQGYIVTTLPPFDFEKPESIKQREEELEKALKEMQEESEQKTEDEKEEAEQEE